MRLILVRHGQTPWNEENRIHGRADIEISKNGLKQAKMVSKMLENEKPVKIFSSTLKRAVKTAQIIAKPLGLPVEQRKELDEINYGIFEGKTFKEIEADKALNNVWVERKKDKYNFKPENGESFKEMNEKRIKPFVKELLSKYFYDTIIVVAHSGTNRLIAGNCLNLPTEKIVHVWQPNEVVYFLDCDEKKCWYSYKEVGEKFPKKGYLTTSDIKTWEEKRQRPKKNGF